jgi:hypothetical protein
LWAGVPLLARRASIVYAEDLASILRSLSLNRVRRLAFEQIGNLQPQTDRQRALPVHQHDAGNVSLDTEGRKRGEPATYFVARD